MGYVTDILIGAAGSLVAAEIYVHAERIARWLTKKAVARLPPEDRERRLEEWTADLEDMPGAVTKLSWAVGCHWAATAANLRKRPPRRALDARTVISRGKVSLRVNYNDHLQCDRCRARLCFSGRRLLAFRTLRSSAPLTAERYNRPTRQLE
jgi:hypothetical protein